MCTPPPHKHLVLCAYVNEHIDLFKQFRLQVIEALKLDSSQGITRLMILYNPKLYKMT